MKRIFTLVSIVLVSAIAFGWLRGREQSAAQTIATLQRQHRDWQQRLAQEDVDQKALRQAIAGRPAEPVTSANGAFSPALSEWLLAGKFSEIPPSLVSELRALLALAGNTTSSEFVLISKPTMRTLRPPSPGRNDKVSDTLSALLSIDPGQRTQIQSALTAARKEFADWARQNVQREGPEGETVVRYTLPAGEDFADSVTNRLLSSIAEVIGAQRTSLFQTYAETWFQIETGYLGAVTNTLSVLRQPGSDGQSSLAYTLTRVGVNSSMSEGPAEIHSQFFPPAWRNIFPGGWPEVAQREGFELPDPEKKVSK